MRRELNSDGHLCADAQGDIAVAADEAGHRDCDTHRVAARPSAKKRRGHRLRDVQNVHASAGEGAAKAGSASKNAVPPLAELIAMIRETHRQRTDLHRSEKSLTLQIKAICRRMCSGEKKDAATLYDAMFGDGEHPHAAKTLAWCRSLILARDAIAPERKSAEKRLAKAAKQLPVYPWIDACRGVSALSFGQIVGECGDLSNYGNPAKLWKRMGLAVFDGKRQRRVADPDLAILYGYSAERRSIMYVIGENLIKTNNQDYRAIYDQRKAYELERAPDMKAGHAHNRSKRYIEKRLLKNLWRAWRAANVEATPVCPLPLAYNITIAKEFPMAVTGDSQRCEPSA